MTTTETWSRSSEGSDIWFIVRELYSSACVCVANRGSLSHWVRISTAKCGNASVLAIDDSKDGNVVSVLLAPHQTTVALALSPKDPTEQMYIDVSVSQTTNVAESHHADIALRAAEASTLEIENWLKQSA